MVQRTTASSSRRQLLPNAEVSLNLLVIAVGGIDFITMAISPHGPRDQEHPCVVASVQEQYTHAAMLHSPARLKP